MNHKLRLATEQDISGIVELEGLLADYHHEIDSYWTVGLDTTEQFREFLIVDIKKPTSLWQVAEVEGKIVGYFSADILSKEYIVSVRKIGHVSHAFLIEEYRGRGIAKEAIQVIFNWFREKNVKVAEVSVDSRNVEGVRAWEGLGFKEFTKKMKMDIN